MQNQMKFELDARKSDAMQVIDALNVIADNGVTEQQADLIRKYAESLSLNHPDLEEDFLNRVIILCDRFVQEKEADAASVLSLALSGLGSLFGIISLSTVFYAVFSAVFFASAIAFFIFTGIFFACSIVLCIKAILASHFSRKADCVVQCKNLASYAHNRLNEITVRKTSDELFSFIEREQSEIASLFFTDPTANHRTVSGPTKTTESKMTEFTVTIRPQSH